MNLASFDWTETARRHALVLAVGLWALFGPLGCGGCGDEDKDTSSKPEQEKAAKEDSSSSADDTLKRRRTAYGLPLPPSVRGIVEEGDEIRVQTHMSLDEVEAFLKARLTDYEVLRPRDQVRAVGLHEFMPQVYAYPYGPYTYVVYMPAPEVNEPEASHDTAQANNAAKETASKAKPVHSRKRGEPVLDRTSDGELLAPGARWGEPYTPPPGSPLHKEHFRSNFGRPYGEWVLQ